MSAWKNIRRSASTAAIGAAALAWVALGEPASAQVTAFKQAMAEAAASSDAIAQFYRETNYEPIWTGEDDAERRQALMNAMALADDHGLPVDRYTPDVLRRIFSDVTSVRQRGFAEVEATKLFLSYARDLQSGILDDPKSIDPGIVRTLPRRDQVKQLTQLSTSDPTLFMRGLIPTTPAYTRLLKTKMALENVLAEGGWGPLVRANSLRPGDSSASVIAMRDRLVRMGYLDRTPVANYDSALEAAVREFQSDHGLEADGVAGAGTIRQINVEPVERLRSVIVGLERERWLNFEEGLGSRHVLVNIVDFQTQLFDDGKVTFETISVVGRSRVDKQTPEFSDEMEHMVINPTWFVPRSIATKEYLPNMQANRNANSYLNFYDASGRQVSRQSINFNAYSARTFPFNMRQPPSDRNALGLVKFMLPNRWNIYLHDSPAKNLFNADVRAFSAGCVRLSKPFEFAYTILARQEADPETFFQTILATGQETQVDLEEHIPVHITYKTAVVPAQGRIQYRPDIYGRDGRLWDALNAAGVSLRAVQS